MSSWLSTISPISDLFPPTPEAFRLLSTGFRCVPLVRFSSPQNHHCFDEFIPLTLLSLSLSHRFSSSTPFVFLCDSKIHPLKKFEQISVLLWTRFSQLQYMGKTSSRDSR